MVIILPSVEIEEFDGVKMLRKIEEAGRTWYKSEELMYAESHKSFIKNILQRGHESVLEHEKITVRVVCDRGVTHEIVRHRIGSYSQESTRYVNYNKKGMEFVNPCFWVEITGDEDKKAYRHELWLSHMKQCEKTYNKLIESGAKPEEARSVLPNSLKTEIVITYNLREWRHFLKLRCANTAHPQMREVAHKILRQLKERLPVVFDDIFYATFPEEILIQQGII